MNTRIRTNRTGAWRWAFATLALVMAAPELSARPGGERSLWERSVVSIEVTRKRYEPFQPWAQRDETFKKHGVVLAPGQILTTADYVNDLVLARLQKGGRGTWYPGQLAWIDYQANLALLTVANTNFWTGLQPAALADPVPTEGGVQICRWRNGNLETRKGEIARLVVRRAKLGFVEHLMMEVDSDINSAGWSEAVVAEGKLVGLTSSQEANNCTVLPAPFLRWIARGASASPRRFLGFFDFIWQKGENPATLAYLKLPGEPRGVVLLDQANGADKSGALRPKDILLSVDGFPIDIDGNYADPDYGNLVLENLFTRGKYAGDTLRAKVWRDGKEETVDYVIPKATYDAELVPQSVYDRPPEYLIFGGLIFQPLTEYYLRGWGGEWRRRAPFRLTYFEQEKPTAERPARVVLSLVLPDPFNLGYQDYRFQTVDKVNGRIVSRISDLAAALKQPREGYHVFEFGPGESIRKLVLDAAEAEAATQRVVERYGAPAAQVIDEP